jgi:hypothetical protein
MTDREEISKLFHALKDELKEELIKKDNYSGNITTALNFIIYKISELQYKNKC